MRRETRDRNHLRPKKAFFTKKDGFVSFVIPVGQSGGGRGREKAFDGWGRGRSKAKRREILPGGREIIQYVDTPFFLV